MGAVIYGGTPAGVVCAVRCAREGLPVILVNAGSHLGGMLSSGLGVFDTNLRGARAPLWQEIRDGVLRAYEQRYGRDSMNYRLAKENLTFEPHVVEAVLTGMVAAEPAIHIVDHADLVRVARCGALLRAIWCRDRRTGAVRELAGEMFVDASYEGDLAAAAGVPCRVGRESRSEYGEPHAGRLFTRKEDQHEESEKFPYESAQGLLKLRPFDSCSGRIFPGSTGEGDQAIMAYNYRVFLSRDPSNQVPIPRPGNYDRNRYLGLLQDERDSWRVRHAIRSRWLLSPLHAFQFRNHREIPNRKISWNHGDFPGRNHDYPEADWPRRQEILREHLDHELGLLWFLQNDQEVPAEVREQARGLGLAKDEFIDHGHLPWEIYVREARRIVGRYVFTERDASLAPGLRRAEPQEDGIAIAEWMMDSHDCTAERQPGSGGDGCFMLSEATRPSQIPFRCLLPQGLDNLLVPVCLSASHVGWGTLRVEPTWIQVAEAAGFALAQAATASVAPARINVASLQRRLAEERSMLGFFNDVDLADPAPWVAAVRYFSTKGFFVSYEARPLDLLDRPTAEIWADAACDEIAGALDAGARARQLAAAEADIRRKGQPSVLTTIEWREMIRRRVEIRLRCFLTGSQGAPAEPDPGETAPLPRGLACAILFDFLGFWSALPSITR